MLYGTYVAHTVSNNSYDRAHGQENETLAPCTAAFSILRHDFHEDQTERYDHAKRHPRTHTKRTTNQTDNITTCTCTHKTCPHTYNTTHKHTPHDATRTHTTPLTNNTHTYHPMLAPQTHLPTHTHSPPMHPYHTQHTPTHSLTSKKKINIYTFIIILGNEGGVEGKEWGF